MSNKLSIRNLLLVVTALSLTHVVALAQARSEQVQTAEGFFKQGIVEVQKGDYKAALADFTQAIKLNPQYAQAYYQRGLVLRKIPWQRELRLPSSSTKDFERAIQLNPKLIEPYLELGVANEDYLERAIAINPGIAEAYYSRGQIRSKYAIDYLDQFHDTGELPASDFISGKLEIPPKSSPEQAVAYVSKIVELAIADYTQAVSLDSGQAKYYLARGLAYIAIQKYQLATSDFTRVVKLDPTQAEAFYKMGDAQRELKNYPAAIEAFSQALALATEHRVEAYRKRGFSRFEMGDKNGAIDDYIQVIRLGFENEDQDAAYIGKLANGPRLAQVYHEIGMTYRYKDSSSVNDRAIKNFDRAIELNPELGNSYYQRGLAYLEQGQAPLAIKDMNQAIRLIQGDAAVYFSSGRAQFEGKNYSRSVLDYTQALGLPSAPISSHYQRGLAYAALADWDKAIADFTESIQLASRTPEAYFQLGLAHDRAGEKVKAIADYRASINHSSLKDELDTVTITKASSNVASVYYRGLARLCLGLAKGKADSGAEVPADKEEDYLGQSIADFNEAISLRHNLAEAYYQRARARWYSGPGYYEETQDNGQRLLAESDLNRALALRPSFAQAYFERGVVYCASERLEKCSADLSRAVELKPRLARAYYSRGRAKGYSELRQGLTDFTKAINLDHDFKEAYAGRSEARYESGNLKGALADLTEVIRLDPDDVQSYRERGDIRLELKDYSGAIEDFTRAIEIHPGKPRGLDHQAGSTYHKRGYARYQLGDGKGGYEDYQLSRLVDYCPTCKSGSSSLANANKAEVFYQKGINLSQRGDKRGAIENLEEAAKLYHAVGNMQKYERVKYQISKL